MKNRAYGNEFLLHKLRQHVWPNCLHDLLERHQRNGAFPLLVHCVKRLSGVLVLKLL